MHLTSIARFHGPAVPTRDDEHRVPLILSSSNYKSYIHLLNHIAFGNKNKKRQIRFLTHQTQSLVTRGEETQSGGKKEKERPRWN